MLTVHKQEKVLLLLETSQRKDFYPRTKVRKIRQILIAYSHRYVSFKLIFFSVPLMLTVPSMPFQIQATLAIGGS